MNIGLIGIYAAILICLGLWASRRKGALVYLIADRAVGPWGIGFSVSAGFFDGFVLVSYTGFVYSYGWPAVFLFLGISLGFLLFYFFSARIQKEGKEKEYFGMSDFFQERWGSKAALVVSIFNIVFYIALLLIQFLFGSAVLQEISGISYEYCLVLIAVIVLSYVSVGGFKAVLTTDMFQWILIVMIIIFFFPYFIRVDPVRSAMSHVDLTKSTGDIIGFLVIGCMGIFSAPELWQRCFAAKDSRSIHGGLLISGTMLPIIGAILAAIGFTAYVKFPGLLPKDALVHVFRDMLPGPMESFGLLLLLSAIMSTADTALFVIAPTFAINVLGIKNEDRAKKATVFVILCSVTLAVFLGLIIRDVLTIAFSLAGLSLGLFPILIGGLIWRLDARVVIVSLIMGMISVLVLLIAGEVRPETSMISLPVVLISLLIGSLWVRFSKTKREHN